MPIKTFTAAVLSSSDVNTYLMKQAVITCTSGTRPASPVQGMTIYETDTSRYATYDGAAWGYALGQGPWTTYTPTLTNMTLGNGTMSARYNLVGKSLSLRIRIAAGTTTTYSGAVTVSLPSGLTTVADEQEMLGKFFAGAANYAGFGYLPASSTTINPYLPTSSSNCACLQMSNTLNIGTTGNLSITGTCELA